METINVLEQALKRSTKRFDKLKRKKIVLSTKAPIFQIISEKKAYLKQSLKVGK